MPVAVCLPRRRRGHVKTEPVPELQQFVLPPANISGNWLHQMATKKEWQTNYIQQLERKLAAALASNASLLKENECLRERVRACPPPPRLPTALALCMRLLTVGR